MSRHGAAHQPGVTLDCVLVGAEPRRPWHAETLGELAVEVEEPTQVHLGLAERGHLPVDHHGALEVVPDHVADAAVAPADDDLALFGRLVLHQPLPGRLDDGHLHPLGGPVEEVPVVGHLLLNARPAPRRLAQPVEVEGPPVGAVHRRQRVDAAPPHPLLLLGRGLNDPALHRVGDVVRRDQALDVVHGEERHAEVPGVVLVPPEAGEGHRRPAVGQGAHGPVLGRELGVEEEQVLGRRHPHDEPLLGPVGRPRAAEDGLVGEPVGAGGLDVEHLGSAAVARLGGQPAGEGGGHLFGVALADVRHEAAL